MDRDSVHRSLVVVVVVVAGGGWEVLMAQVRRNARVEKEASVVDFATRKAADVAVIGVAGDVVDFGLGMLVAVVEGILRQLMAGLVEEDRHRTAVVTAGVEDTCPETIRGRDIAAVAGIAVVEGAPWTTRAVPRSRDGL